MKFLIYLGGFPPEFPGLPNDVIGLGWGDDDFQSFPIEDEPDHEFITTGPSTVIGGKGRSDGETIKDKPREPSGNDGYYGENFDDSDSDGEITMHVEPQDYYPSDIVSELLGGDVDLTPVPGEKVEHEDAPDDDTNSFHYIEAGGIPAYYGPGNILEINAEEGYFTFLTDDGRVGTANAGYLNPGDRPGNRVEIPENSESFVPADRTDVYGEYGDTDPETGAAINESNLEYGEETTVTVESNWEDLYGEGSGFNPETATGDF
jgi:hypothetical protein